MLSIQKFDVITQIGHAKWIYVVRLARSPNKRKGQDNCRLALNLLSNLEVGLLQTKMQ